MVIRFEDKNTFELFDCALWFDSTLRHLFVVQRTNIIMRNLTFYSFFLLLLCVFQHSENVKLSPHPAENKFSLPTADVGEPLFLTPYIEAGQLSEGRNLSKVGPLEGTDIESYAGFFTVNKEYNSNIFFWYFPALVSFIIFNHLNLRL